MRIAVEGTPRKLDGLQQPIDPLLPRCLVPDLVHLQRLGDHIANGKARVEGCSRVLEDHPDAAPQLLQVSALRALLRAGSPDQFLAEDLHVAPGGWDQSQQRPADGGFPGARLPHQADDLTTFHVEGDAVDRTERSFPGAFVLHDQFIDLEGRRGVLGDIGRYGTELAMPCPQVRNRVQEFFGVGMLRVEEDLLRRTAFDDVALEHHGDPVGHVRHDAHVVGDEQDSGVQFLLQRPQQIENVGLHGHVEGRGGLVGDDHLGVAGKGHGDHHTLPHTTRQLVGVLLDAPLRIRDTDGFEQVDRLLPGDLTVCDVVHLHRLGELLADLDDRVQGSHRLLENHGDAIATQTAHFTRAEAPHCLVRNHRVAGDARGPGQQTEGRGGCHRLARTRFADQGHHFAGLDREADALDGLNPPELSTEADIQFLELEHRLEFFGRRSGLVDFSAHFFPLSPSAAAGRRHRAGRRR